jgi:predicted ester cyclase
LKKIRRHHIAASLVVVGVVVAGSGLTGSSMGAGKTDIPGASNVFPSSAYVAPTAAGTKLGKANIARFEQIVERGLNQGDLSIIRRNVSPKVVDHQLYGPGYPGGRGGIMALTAALRTAFPDLHAEAPTLVASNDGTQTFAIIRTTGTNTRPYLGVPATGRKIRLNIVESALWKNGVMVEHWGVADNIGLLGQLGFFPLSQFPRLDVKKLDKQYQEQLANPPTLHPRTATTPQAKIAAVTRLVDVGVNQGNLFVAPEFQAPNYVDHEYYGEGYPPKPEADKAKMTIAVNRTAVPNLKTKIHQVAVIGPHVFGMLEAKGTVDGSYLGIPPTGRKIGIDVFEYWHFNKKGKIDVHDGIADLMGLIAQMGFVPPGSVPVYSQNKVDPKFLPFLKQG